MHDTNESLTSFWSAPPLTQPSTIGYCKIPESPTSNNTWVPKSSPLFNRPQSTSFICLSPQHWPILLYIQLPFAPFYFGIHSISYSSFSSVISFICLSPQHQPVLVYIQLPFVPFYFGIHSTSYSSFSLRNRTPFPASPLGKESYICAEHAQIATRKQG